LFLLKAQISLYFFAIQTKVVKTFLFKDKAILHPCLLPFFYPQNFLFPLYICLVCWVCS